MGSWREGPPASIFNEKLDSSYVRRDDVGGKSSNAHLPIPSEAHADAHNAFQKMAQNSEQSYSKL